MYIKNRIKAHRYIFNYGQRISYCVKFTVQYIKYFFSSTKITDFLYEIEIHEVALS